MVKFILGLTCLSLLGVDWLQTIYISKHKDRYYEINPILGEHPNKGKVNFYFGVIVGSYLISSFIMPNKLWYPLTYSCIGIELVTVVHNKNIGIGLSLDF